MLCVSIYEIYKPIFLTYTNVIEFTNQFFLHMQIFGSLQINFSYTYKFLEIYKPIFLTYTNVVKFTNEFLLHIQTWRSLQTNFYYIQYTNEGEFTNQFFYTYKFFEVCKPIFLPNMPSTCQLVGDSKPIFLANATNQIMKRRKNNKNNYKNHS